MHEGSNGKYCKPNKAPKPNYFKKKKINNPKNLKLCVKQAPKCQFCNSKRGLSAHHIIFRSEGRDDSLENLISLCFDCHRKAHDGYYIKEIYITARNFVIFELERLNDKKYEQTILELRKK